MKYENESLCAACGGQCCKSDPCFFMPEDFQDLSVEGLLRELKDKDYLCIMLDKVPRIIMRSSKWPKIINPVLMKETNPCMLLTSTGCTFSYDERPTGGKSLVPDPNGHCKSILSLDDIRLAWAPYMPILLQVMARL